MMSLSFSSGICIIFVFALGSCVISGDEYKEFQVIVLWM